jgi:hypothetical protein
MTKGQSLLNFDKRTRFLDFLALNCEKRHLAYKTNKTQLQLLTHAQLTDESRYAPCSGQQNAVKPKLTRRSGQSLRHYDRL